MEILLTIAGIAVGGIISWVLSHHYYKRQTKEQVNPIPYIKEVNTAVLELYGMTMERQDVELQRGVKTLVMSMLFTKSELTTFVHSVNPVICFEFDVY